MTGNDDVRRAVAEGYRQGYEDGLAVAAVNEQAKIGTIYDRWWHGFFFAIGGIGVGIVAAMITQRFVS